MIKFAVVLALASSAAILGSVQPVEPTAAHGFVQTSRPLALGAAQTASYDEGVVRLPALDVRVPRPTSRRDRVVVEKAWVCGGWEDSRIGGQYKRCEWK